MGREELLIGKRRTLVSVLIRLWWSWGRNGMEEGGEQGAVLWWW